MIVYPQAASAFLRGDIHYLTDTIKVWALNSTYVYADSHTYLSSVPGGARLGTAVTLTGKTVVDGEAHADDVIIPAIAAGSTITAVIVYQDTGVEATSRLIDDTTRRADTVPLAEPTTGGAIELTWPSGRVFKI